MAGNKWVGRPKQVGPICTPETAHQRMFDPNRRSEARGKGKVNAIHKPRALQEVAPGRGMDIIHGAMHAPMYAGKKAPTTKGLGRAATKK